MDIRKLQNKLRWFFNCSDSLLGLRSNCYDFTNITNTSCMVEQQGQWIISALPKIREHRLLHQALSSLSREQFRQLTSVYMDEYQAKYPAIIRHVFDNKTGLALCLSFDLKRLTKLCINHRHQTLSDIDKLELHTLTTQVNDTFEKLHKQLQYDTYILQLDKLRR